MYDCRALQFENLLFLQGIRNAIGERFTSKSKAAHLQERFKRKEGGASIQPVFKQTPNDKIRELFKEKYPNLRETITTRLLTCLTCGKRVCRDVNGAFNILTNFLDSIYNGSLGLSTLKHLKKKEPPGPMSALSPKRPKKPRSGMKPIEKTSRVKQLKLGNPK